MGRDRDVNGALTQLCISDLTRCPPLPSAHFTLEETERVEGIARVSLPVLG